LVTPPVSQLRDCDYVKNRLARQIDSSTAFWFGFAKLAKLAKLAS
jgi:hypothetical protein